MTIAWELYLLLYSTSRRKGSRWELGVGNRDVHPGSHM
jgi:hypothetical protein